MKAKDIYEDLSKEFIRNGIGGDNFSKLEKLYVMAEGNENKKETENKGGTQIMIVTKDCGTIFCTVRSVPRVGEYVAGMSDDIDKNREFVVEKVLTQFHEKGESIYVYVAERFK